MNTIAAAANERGVEVSALGISPEQVARVSALEDDGTLTNRLARQVVDALVAGGGGAGAAGVDALIEARGWKVAGEDELVAAVDAAIAANADAAEKVRAGNVGAAGPIVGAVMKATGGSADAKRARELILEQLSS